MRGARTTLVTIPFSHYCEKARWALEHAGVAFHEEGHVPGFHAVATRRASGRRTVPVLLCEGRTLADSADILAYADALAPRGRKLLAEDPGARGEALALQKRFDDDLGPHVRRVVYFHLLPDRATTMRLMDHGTPLWERAALRLAFGRLRSMMKRYMHIDAEHAARSRAMVLEVFAEVSARVAGRRYLVGERFGAADLTFAALAAPGLAPDEYGAPLPRDGLPPEADALIRELRATPAGAFALRIYREHRRPGGRS